jgi:DNA-binding response OmpR family regulator
MTNAARVLIVDDEPLIGKILSDILTPRSCSCMVAVNADRALGMLSRYSFDLTLVDILMPGMSGLELLDVIKISRLSLPVIMLTALGDAGTVVQAMKKGASDYVVKPFTLADVYHRVDAVLKENSRLPAFPTQPVSGQNVSDWNFSDRMQAIAQDVEAMVSHFDFHDRIVTERTIEIAQQLAVPDSDIQAWADARRDLSSLQEKRINLAARFFGESVDRL